jgi:hypothetical protein
MMRLDLTVDAREIERALLLAPKQIPFAVSKAVNQIAWLARTELRDRLAESMTLRTGWTKGGLQIEKGSKTTLDAKVGALADRWWMASQAMGDPARKPPKGVPHVASVGKEGAPRPTETAVVTKSLRVPLAEKKISGHSYFLFRRAGRIVGVFYRSGPLRPAKRKTYADKPLGEVRPRFPVEKAWGFPAIVKMHARWPMEKIVAGVVDREWSKAAEQAVIEALWSAR